MLSLRVNLCIIYENDLNVFLRVLFIRIPLYPTKEKKFNEKKYDKKQLKKAQGGKVKLKQKREGDDSGNKLVDSIKLITNVLSVALKTFAKHLKIKVAKLHIRVGSDDAARTAILYGAISSSVACLIDLLDEITNLSRIKNSSISVEPDFLSESCEAMINIKLSISLFGALSVLIRSVWRYITLKNKNPINKPKGI